MRCNHNKGISEISLYFLRHPSKNYSNSPRASVLPAGHQGHIAVETQYAVHSGSAAAAYCCRLCQAPGAHSLHSVRISCSRLGYRRNKKSAVRGQLQRRNRDQCTDGPIRGRSLGLCSLRVVAHSRHVSRKSQQDVSLPRFGRFVNLSDPQMKHSHQALAWAFSLVVPPDVTSRRRRLRRASSARFPN